MIIDETTFKIIKEDKKTGWCLVTDREPAWEDFYNAGVYYMNRKTNQEIFLEFDFKTVSEKVHISKDAMIAGFEAFLDAFAKKQPLVKVSYPFYDD